MRSTLAALLVLVGCAPPSPASVELAAAPAAPTGPTVTWHGMIRCDPIPGVANFELRQLFDLMVAGGQATYERAIRRADTSGDSGERERGGGPVAADGAVRLTGSASTANYSYDAEYSGRLSSNGAAHLVGVQHWRPRRAVPVDRACTIDLRR